VQFHHLKEDLPISPQSGALMNMSACQRNIRNTQPKINRMPSGPMQTTVGWRWSGPMPMRIEG